MPSNTNKLRYSHFTLGRLGISALLVLLCNTAIAGFVSVSTSCYLISPATVDSCNAQNLSTDAGPYPGSGYIPNAIEQSTKYFQSASPTYHVEGTGLAAARADYGDLGIFSESYIEGVFAAGGYFGIASNAVATFSDTLTINTGGGPGVITLSGLLNVNIQANSLQSTQQSGGSNDYNVVMLLEAGGVEFVRARLSNNIGYSGFTPLISGLNPFSYDLDVFDGQIINILGHLIASETSSVGSASSSGGGGNAFTSVSALNSLHLYVDPMTQGLSISTLSGHNYATPNLGPNNAVPEPETYTMMLAGLILLGFQGRGRKQKGTA